MKKWYILLAILAIAAGVGVAIYFSNSSNQNNNNNSYNASRTNYNENNQNIYNTNMNNISNDLSSNITDTENNDNKKEEQKNTPSKKLLTSYTTKIYTKESDRQNNVSIACSTLNDTTVKNGDTFSFSHTVGKATTKKGYEKADVFVNGDKIQALGGGLCQVSSTLYNAVLKASDLKVTERHSHSNDVPYVPDGKDAAVSYGTYDFKFINKTGNDIVIEAKNTKNKVTIKIYELR